MIGEIQLQWPNSALLPNSRSHWTARAAATRSARTTAAWATRAAGISKLDLASLKATIVFHPPDRRRRDLDSMLSSLKPSLDGIADEAGENLTLFHSLAFVGEHGQQFRADRIGLRLDRGEVREVAAFPPRLVRKPGHEQEARLLQRMRRLRRLAAEIPGERAFAAAQRGRAVAFGPKNLGMSRPAVKSAPFAHNTPTHNSSSRSSSVMASES